MQTCGESRSHFTCSPSLEFTSATGSHVLLHMLTEPRNLLQEYPLVLASLHLASPDLQLDTLAYNFFQRYMYEPRLGVHTVSDAREESCNIQDAGFHLEQS